MDLDPTKESANAKESPRFLSAYLLPGKGNDLIVVIPNALAEHKKNNFGLDYGMFSRIEPLTTADGHLLQLRLNRKRDGSGAFASLSASAHAIVRGDYDFSS